MLSALVNSVSITTLMPPLSLALAAAYSQGFCPPELYNMCLCAAHPKTNTLGTQLMVPKSGDCFGKSLHPTCGVRRGDVISPILINIAVDAVLQEWDVQVTKAHLTGLAVSVILC
jgi:hypothetical protein